MDKLDHLGWVVSSSYAIGDVRFAVRSTSSVFGDWLARALAAYEVEDVEDYLYSVVVPDAPAAGAKAREFFILYKGSSAIVRTLDPVTLGRALFTELNGQGLHQRDDAAYLMASVVQMRGEPVLIPASLGPGLAKLGRRTSKLGVRTPGQFAIAIDLNGEVLIPVPETLELAGDPLIALAELFPWQGREELRFVDAAEPVRRILVPAQNADTPTQLTRKGYALAHLTSWSLNLDKTGGRGLRALGRFVEAASSYEAAWTDAGEAVTGIAQVVEVGA
jgi:hypothetical protein